MVNWDAEQDNLILYLKQGKTYESIGKIFGITKSSVREQVIKRGLDVYYKHHARRKSLDEKIERKLKWYPSSEFPNTREYLKNELTKDINFKTYKGILLKEDIIEQYHISRVDSKYKFDYDFSKLPPFVKDRKEKFTVIVNEVSPKTHKLVGEWETCFKHLVIQRMDNGVCGGIKAKEFCALTREEFIDKCIKRFGNTYDYSKIVYVNMFTPVLIKCNRCGKYFWQVPSTHLDSPGLGCPDCAMADVGFRKYLGLEELSNRCEEIYGPIYDFTGSLYQGISKPLIAKNKITEKEVIATPDEFLRGVAERDRMSSGEKHVSHWLDTNKIQYSYNTSIFNKIFGRKTKYVRIDFIVHYKNVEYWIEYNGEQHYKRVKHWVSEKEFLEGLSRDKNVRDYCKENEIILLEIPYTYKNYSDISDILDKIILQNCSSELIRLPEIKYE